MRAVCAALALTISPQRAEAADPGLVTKPSSHPVQETIARFQDAVKAKGWIVFTAIDHAAAARQAGLELKPRTVILFGNPKAGTAPMQKAATLAIDNPPKALVWEDADGKVWLTYNSAAYIASQLFPRHGLAMPAEGVANLEKLLAEVSDQATR